MLAERDQFQKLKAKRILTIYSLFGSQTKMLFSFLRSLARYRATKSFIIINAMIPSTLIFTQFEGGEMIRLEITELTHLVLSIGVTNTIQIGFSHGTCLVSSVICQYVSVSPICRTNKGLNLISQLVLCLYLEITTCLLFLLNQ